MKIVPRPDFTKFTRQRLIPYECQWEITSQCHLHCVMCLRTVMDPERELSFDEVRDVLDQLKDMGTLRMGFTGGEVFTRPDFLDILEYTDSLGIKTGLITTGSLLRDQDIQRMKKIKGLDRIGVSVYSLRPKVHASITQHDSLKASLRAVFRLKKEGFPVRVNAPIMTLNYTDAMTLREFFKERGISFVHDLTLSPTDTGETYPLQYQVGPQHFDRIRPMLKTIKTNDPGCASAKEMMEEDPHPFCGTARTEMAIDAHGNLYPCNLLRLSFGNVRTTRIQDAWDNSPVLAAIRGFKTTSEFNCSNCGHFGGCQLCLGLTFRQKGDFTLPPSPECVKTSDEMADNTAREVLFP